MRVEEEGLNPADAQDAVLSENLFGLELDPRCTQIAAFNVALAAWKAGGYRTLPELNIGCSGIRVAGSRDSWLELAGDDPRLRDGLERLHDVFKDADTLGSLIDPKRTIADDGLLAVEWDEIEPLLTKALTREKTSDPAAAVFGNTAKAVAKAADLLSREYTLISTNPPFRTEGDLEGWFIDHLSSLFGAASTNLATVFLVRCLALARGPESGAVSLVLPQHWLYQWDYTALREELLFQVPIQLVAKLGTGAFETISGEVVNVGLFVLGSPGTATDGRIRGIDCEAAKSAHLKAAGLKTNSVKAVVQGSQVRNPDSRIILADLAGHPLLETYAACRQGIKTGDDPRYRRSFWELPF